MCECLQYREGACLDSRRDDCNLGRVDVEIDEIEYIDHRLQRLENLYMVQQDNLLAVYNDSITTTRTIALILASLLGLTIIIALMVASDAAFP